MTSNNNSRFKVNEQATQAWVNTEKYLIGRMVDGPADHPGNVYLHLSNGVTLLAAMPLLCSTQHYSDRTLQLRVMAKENIVSGELRNLHVLSFDDYQPVYNAEEFQQMVSRGTAAWADISNTTEWLETLRGNRA